MPKIEVANHNNKRDKRTKASRKEMHSSKIEIRETTTLVKESQETINIEVRSEIKTKKIITKKIKTYETSMRFINHQFSYKGMINKFLARA